MKRSIWLGFLLVLASCVLGPVPRTITVSADRSTVFREPLETRDLRVRLSAEVSGLAGSDIVWRANDGRSPEVAFPDGRTGTEVIYQAPNRDGFFTVTASSEDGEVSDEWVVKVVGKQLVPAEDATTRVDFKAMGVRESRLLLVTVSATAAARGSALYFELDQDMSLELIDMTKAEAPTIASSSSSESFAAGKEALSSARLTSEAITPRVSCRGACIIQDAQPGDYLLRITNPNTEVVTYALYVYVEDYQDPGEPQNNTAAGASVIEEQTSGAIESLGDQDYFVSNTTGTLVFSSSSELALRAEVLGKNNPSQSLATLSAGEEFELPVEGALIRVYVEGNTRAAASARSAYTLEVRP